jgi:hypothetical protein
MTWLLFAFSGPVLWAVLTHLDHAVRVHLRDCADALVSAPGPGIAVLQKGAAAVTVAAGVALVSR